MRIVFLEKLGMFINFFWHYLGESCVSKCKYMYKIQNIIYIYVLYIVSPMKLPLENRTCQEGTYILLYVGVKTHTPLFPTQVTFISMTSLCSLLCFPCFETMKTMNPTQPTETDQGPHRRGRISSCTVPPVMGI